MSGATEVRRQRLGEWLSGRLGGPLVVSGLLLIVSVGVYIALCFAQPTPMADMLVYRAEGQAVARGRDLYGFTVTEWDLPATYPPFAAMLFVPATWVPVFVLKVVFSAGNLALLAALAQLSARVTGRPRRAEHRTVAVVLAVAGGLWLEPVFQTMYFGQINLALTVLVLWDLSRPDGARWKGFAIGVAAGVKLTPAIFAVYLLLTGRVRAACAAAAGFAATVLIGTAVLPGATVEFWTRRIFETGRVGKLWIVDNQSLQGFLARLLHTAEPGAVWACSALVVACGGLAVAAWAGRRGLEAWGVLATAFTALLITPISWSHHWVWCVPLLFLLAAEAPRWVTGTVALAFTARSMWLVPKQGDLDLHLPWYHQASASPYPLLALAFLVAVAVRCGRAERG